jgi:hypothetical protein
MALVASDIRDSEAALRTVCGDNAWSSERFAAGSQDATGDSNSGKVFALGLVNGSVGSWSAPMERVDESADARPSTRFLAFGPRLARGRSNVHGSPACRHGEHRCRGLVVSHLAFLRRHLSQALLLLLSGLLRGWPSGGGEVVDRGLELFSAILDALCGDRIRRNLEWSALDGDLSSAKRRKEHSSVGHALCTICRIPEQADLIRRDPPSHMPRGVKQGSPQNLG